MRKMMMMMMKKNCPNTVINNGLKRRKTKHVRAEGQATHLRKQKYND